MMRCLSLSARRLSRDRRGSTAVEMAVVLPVFLTMVLGLIDLGQLFWTQTAMQHAVEMAARCASITPGTCGTSDQIKTYAGTQAYGLTLPSGTFTATTPTCGNQVAASYTYNVITPMLPVGSISLSAQSCYPK